MTTRELGALRYRARRRILDALENQQPQLGLEDIATRVGITVQAVRKTWLGDLHSERVLQAFRDAGVPEKYLYDPRRHGIEMRGYGFTRKTA